MITWMQRHRKYLIVVIWISTIAFVGAGFVGWGSYSYRSFSSEMAKVGDVVVTKDEYAAAYSNIFNYYNKMSGGKLTPEEAKKAGIENMAMEGLVQNALYENFANEIGLAVSDEEVATKIASMQAFQKNGVFVREIYLQTLGQNGLKVKDFEASLKKEILSDKIQKILNPKGAKLEADTLGAAYYGKNRLEIKSFSLKDMQINLTEEDVKKFWEGNKQKYQTPERYDIEYLKVAAKDMNLSDVELKKIYNDRVAELNDKDGKPLSYEAVKDKLALAERMKLAKKAALKEFIAFKNKEDAGKVKSAKNIGGQSGDVPFALLSQLPAHKNGEPIKPVDVGDGFVMARVTKLYASQVMPYEEAKFVAANDYRNLQATETLKKQADDAFKNGFKGTDIGFMGRNDADKIKVLAKNDAERVLKDVFENKTEKNLVMLDDKIVVYKILEQKLFSDDLNQTQKDQLLQQAANIKSQLLNSGAINYLRKKYEIKIYKNTLG